MTSRFQPIYDIAALCALKGLQEAVLCPGSRCAPLTLAFTRHPNVKCRTISDERSAGFIALGISQKQKQPTVVVCTSGTAAYNLSPAVAEAFFSKTPLIIFTADRPAEWIGQHDGQTIYQSGIFGDHVKQSFQLPQEYDHADNGWAINRIVNEAINLSRQEPKGPVHINAPFREPLYPSTNESFGFSNSIRIMDDQPASHALSKEQKDFIQSSWANYHHILMVAGQQSRDERLLTALTKFFSRYNIPIIGDIISNLHSIEKVVRHADLFLGQCSDEISKSLKPDLLITFGESTISKNVKLFLRKHSPVAHWHIQSGGPVADTFQSVTNIFRTTPVSFFEFLSTLSPQNAFENQRQNNYHKLWEVEERRSLRSLEEFFPQKILGELELVRTVIQSLPTHCHLHLANSMSVRYANFIGLDDTQQHVEVYANRGTSGIDGCTSTAVGHSMVSDVPQVLITGDIAFFYDRNAFWHNYPIPNLKLLLLNNHGGLIFKMIDGPGDTPEAEEYFITRQVLNAEHLCREFGVDYLTVGKTKKLEEVLTQFFSLDDQKPKILELESEGELNKTLFENLKQKIKKGYEL